jgi:hypothetical protein
MNSEPNARLGLPTHAQWTLASTIGLRRLLPSPALFYITKVTHFPSPDNFLSRAFGLTAGSAPKLRGYERHLPQHNLTAAEGMYVLAISRSFVGTWVEQNPTELQTQV